LQILIVFTVQTNAVLARIRDFFHKHFTIEQTLSYYNAW